MRCLITGATGFVGSAVVRAALRDGWQVVAARRPASDMSALEGLSVETVQVDLGDADALAAAMAGCDAVFHVAADYRLWAANPEELYENNVEGTRRVCQAVQAAGVSRLVYTSSVATLGLPKDGTPGDEDTPVCLDDMIGDYKRSKYLAEAVVREFVDDGLDAVIVNPSAPIGPRDHKPTPTGQMVLEAAAGRMPAFVDTGLNVVHVDDVARGHLQAHARGVSGRRYVLGGVDMTLAEILALVAEIVDRPPPRVRLPHNLVLPVAHVAERIARVTGRPPRVTVDGVKLAKKHMFFSHARATRELGYRARPARDALADAVAWYYAHRYLPAGKRP
ncbi:hopanoid-associated sugar epimerase [Salinisphaera sp. Q1T1-3]|uniref:hopanoid-associated sugar epimerase n=1 Tax=Salinisphaera sp. Q1T1-3 TaxID=2321229 RepID=UPI000E71A4A0|nr:hopanoid-associated sugar epimerase [Salinisphaera sp. Q1T1-3]RJS93966.1 NAD-dependent epimerase/dehydratase family protein [Salinisphaera sp. Q1T1-3]